MRYFHAAADFGEDEHFDLSLSLHLPAGSLFKRMGALLRPAPRELLNLAPADSVGVSIGSLCPS